MALSRTPVYMGTLLIGAALLFADLASLVWTVVSVIMLLLAVHMVADRPRVMLSHGPALADDPDPDPAAETPPDVVAPAVSALADTDLLLRMERLVAVGQLSAGIAHEINNPVAYVHSNLVDIREDFDNLHRFIRRIDELAHDLPRDSDIWRGMVQAYRDEQVADILALFPERLKDCIEGVDRIGHIVHDMKTLVRGGGSNKALCNLNQDLATVINIARTRIKGQVQFHVHLLNDCPPLWCNPSQIGQVVLNILVNAVQAVGDNSGDISLTQTLRDGELEITICDDGPGMSPELLQRAFEPFFTTKGEQDGTGMGLPLSRQLVQDHGGRLEVESEPGVGTCFHIYLPVPAQEGQHV
ncbi:sensor histidine kinase [Parathalassolituus penaei]|uniref:histidine kinase n=1 Tax=Parathalassolituus penaei TaxID=2997323 RepID=A0A9X3EFE5_9GAMM|nr:ATP-binding protein [Parathalassolituus penaei]MCY0966266.1 ATP-binding protein [Parathalassolituus penaei]